MRTFDEATIRNKYTRLVATLAQYDSLAIGFSGGVDSTLLAKAAKDANIRNLLLVTVHGAMIPDFEMEDIRTLVSLIGAQHKILEVDTDLIEGFNDNTSDRCYYCKKQLFSQIKDIASAIGIMHIAEGSNMDDLSDFRPGARAIKELSIVSPLLETEWTKAEIREISRILGLPTYDKPNYACLASRIPFNEPITKDKLKRVELSETALREAGFRQFRVRDHGDIARIEIAEDEMSRMFDPCLMQRISAKLKSYGYIFVTMDLEGYAIGRLSHAGRVEHEQRKA